jgi:hypothetical protein
MKSWYPNAGVAVFIFKFLFLTFLYVLTMWLIYRLVKKNDFNNQFLYTTKIPFIFVAVVFITFFVRENYPFSFYPMYNHFPNFAYTFFFEDENGQSLDKELNDNHGSISHIYFAEFDSKGWRVGNAKETKHHLQIVGESIIKKSFSLEALKKKGVKKVYVKRINNHFENNVLKIDTTLISTYGIK